jgi:hypothetical protein
MILCSGQYYSSAVCEALPHCQGYCLLSLLCSLYIHLCAVCAMHVTQQLCRVLREEVRHAALVEQACRAAAVIARTSFSAKSALISDKCADAIKKALYLHKAHAGVQLLGKRAIDAIGQS